ncbi:hypothetical protein CRENBAI_005634, partial [Crenichthys baileyi]
HIFHVFAPALLVASAAELVCVFNGYMCRSQSRFLTGTKAAKCLFLSAYLPCRCSTCALSLALLQV